MGWKSTYGHVALPRTDLGDDGIARVVCGLCGRTLTHVRQTGQTPHWRHPRRPRA